MSAVRVAIVDDSKTARLALRQALECDPKIQVVGEASCAQEALDLIARTDPDLITMDVYLHRENGIDVTATIMSRTPRPILIITGLNPTDPQLVYKAIDAGALEVCAKLPAINHPTYEAQRWRLVRLVKTLSTIPVVHRFRKIGHQMTHPQVSIPSRRVSSEGYRLLLIGASTGGPPAVCTVLQRLPAPFSLPIAVVQHISVGFGDGFGKWLAELSGHKVDVVRQSLGLMPGRVYVASDDLHLQVTSRSLIGSSDAPPRRLHRPSVDVLFESGAEVFGAATIAVILTGMGSDGTEGMAKLKHEGAFTLAQEPETCVVDSMPTSAITVGAIDVVEDLETIADTICSKVNPRCVAK